MDPHQAVSHQTSPTLLEEALPINGSVLMDLLPLEVEEGEE